jgi:hypothetical protein
MKMKWQWLLIGMVTALGTTPLRAAQNRENLLSEILKSSIHKMVVEVKEANDPGVKRKIIGHYLSGMEQGLTKMASNSELTATDRKVVAQIGLRFQNNLDIFYGTNETHKVPDSELNAFADYIQQQSEQAGSDWNGGIYLSTGAILILILLLIIFT